MKKKNHMVIDKVGLTRQSSLTQYLAKQQRVSMLLDMYNP